MTNIAKDVFIISTKDIRKKITRKQVSRKSADTAKPVRILKKNNIILIPDKDWENLLNLKVTSQELLKRCKKNILGRRGGRFALPKST